MGLLTCIVAAAEDELAAIGESARPLDAWSGIACRDIDTAKVATLHCLLTGDDFELALGAHEPAYIGERGALVLRVAAEVGERLASLDEAGLELVAGELAATAEFELAQWEAADVQALVMDLADLAQLAESQDQALFVWMQPVPV